MKKKSKISEEKTEKGVIHKDLEPTETILYIRDRLARIGLSITEPVNLKNPFDNCWSCRVRDCDYPLLETYGKGISREYALASAYAEYIERLQCYVHEWFGKMGWENDIHPNSLYLDKHELAEKHPDLFCSLYLDNISSNKLLCLQFAMPFEGRVGWMPYNLMLSGTGSTGMCAGNSPDEAIVHGICEIMERYALKMIATKKIAFFPTVPLDFLPIKDTLTLNMINELKSKGLETIVKDCTFNGSIPVISVIIIDKQKDLCGVTFGSDPVFEIAFQRCVTEIYQNNKNLVCSYSNTIKNKTLGKDLINHPENLMESLLEGSIVNGSNLARAFMPASNSNRYYLKYLLNMLRQNKRTVYIRDFSFLGFPSFYVFIPGMSVFSLVSEDFTFGFKGPDLILKVLSQVGDEIPNETIKKLADVLSCHLKSDNPFMVEMPRFMERVLERAPVIAWMDPMIFIAFIFIEVGDLQSALDVLGMSENPFSNFAEIKSILKKYCTLLLQQKNRKDVLQQLKKNYQDSLYYDNLEHLVNGYYSSFYNKVPKDHSLQKFDGLPLPLCADIDGCLSCLCRPYCYKDKFLQIRSKILKEYHECNQHAMIQYINQLMEIGE